MKTYTLTEQQLQSVVNYLAARPFGEVYQLVNMLGSIQPNVDASSLTTPTLVEVDGQEEAKQA